MPSLTKPGIGSNFLNVGFSVINQSFYIIIAVFKSVSSKWNQWKIGNCYASETWTRDKRGCENKRPRNKV